MDNFGEVCFVHIMCKYEKNEHWITCIVHKTETKWKRERDFYVSGKTCLPFHGHKTAIRSYYQWRMSYWCSLVLETKCVLFFSNMLISCRVNNGIFVLDLPRCWWQWFRCSWSTKVLMTVPKVLFIPWGLWNLK